MEPEGAYTISKKLSLMTSPIFQKFNPRLHEKALI